MTAEVHRSPYLVCHDPLLSYTCVCHPYLSDLLKSWRIEFVALWKSYLFIHHKYGLELASHDRQRRLLEHPSLQSILAHYRSCKAFQHCKFLVLVFSFFSVLQRPGQVSSSLELSEIRLCEDVPAELVILAPWPSLEEPGVLLQILTFSMPLSRHLGKSPYRCCLYVQSENLDSSNLIHMIPSCLNCSV